MALQIAISLFTGKCWLPLWSEMDMRLLQRCAAPRRGSRGAGKGSWLCRIRRGSPPCLPPAPVSSVCELYSVYCAVLWRVAHHGNYHGERLKHQRESIRDIVSVISHDTHNTRLLWELRRGNYWYGGFVYFWCMLHVYYLLCHVTCHVITHSPICNKISIRFDPDREGDEIHESDR